MGQLLTRASAVVLQGWDHDAGADDEQLTGAVGGGTSAALIWTRLQKASSLHLSCQRSDRIARLQIMISARALCSHISAFPLETERGVNLLLPMSMSPPFHSTGVLDSYLDKADAQLRAYRDSLASGPGERAAFLSPRYSCKGYTIRRNGSPHQPQKHVPRPCSLSARTSASQRILLYTPPGLVTDAHRAAATAQARGGARAAQDEDALRRSFVSQNFRTHRVQSGFEEVDNSNRPFVLPPPLSPVGTRGASCSVNQSPRLDTAHATIPCSHFSANNAAPVILRACKPSGHHETPPFYRYSHAAAARERDPFEHPLRDEIESLRPSWLSAPPPSGAARPAGEPAPPTWVDTPQALKARG